MQDSQRKAAATLALAIVMIAGLLGSRAARADCPPCGPGTCPGDLTVDGTVGAGDLLLLLAEWGPCDGSGECAGCVGDVTCDGHVGVPDLLELLGNWGDCPWPPGSCDGICGGLSPLSCGCDAVCCLVGDCCLDKCEQCGTDYGNCDGPLTTCVDEPGHGCAGYCGGESPDGCACDQGCFLRCDCCDNVCEMCMFFPHCPYGYGCWGACGGVSPTGIPCWCDAFCVQFDDCCFDACCCDEVDCECEVFHTNPAACLE